MLEYLFFIFLVILIVLSIAYVILITSYCFAWIKLSPPTLPVSSIKTSVSIIIAARNEAETIFNCLTSIINQTYSKELMEVIIVDDNSTDETIQVVQEFCNKYENFTLIKLAESGSFGKKQAINSGIKIAKGELIVTTDADCVMGPNWLNKIATYYKQSNAKMIVAPVCFYNEKNVFEKMQSLEFMALIASSGASLYLKKAIMCNGANLAYTKQVFYEVNGFDGIDNSSSGDDVLLMYKIKSKFPNDVHFLKHTDAVVFTKAKPTWNEFVNQRKRWASKGFGSLNTETKFVSLIVYFFNFFLLMFSVISIFYYSNTAFHLEFYKISLILIGIKCIIDFLLLFLATSFFKKRRLLIYFLPEQILYMLYITVIGFLGKLGKYEWKERRTKN